jgi:hypothetical protein
MSSPERGWGQPSPYNSASAFDLFSNVRQLLLARATTRFGIWFVTLPMVFPQHFAE